jgi:hypothetical protein
LNQRITLKPLLNVWNFDSGVLLESRRPTLYEDQEDVLGLVITHAQALIWIMNLAKNHDLVEPDIAIQVIEEMKSESKTVWEEQLWEKIRQRFKEELPSANIYQFSPETRGPDT